MFSQLHDIYCNGKVYTHVVEYDMDRGYLDHCVLRKHYLGSEVIHTLMVMNGRILINRIFGKIEVVSKLNKE